MSCYIIPIGGTGIRVMKSIIRLMAAGCLPDDKSYYKIMCVDSDDVNGDYKELESLIKEYRKVKNLFPEIRLTTVNEIETSIWSPLSGELNKDKRSAMKDMISASHMSEDAKQVLEFLYTKKERDKILEGGFYGHTSIGAYFMAQEVVKDNQYTPAWNDFFDNICANDKIFIIGSIFGGTGASGVPTIARLIHDNEKTRDVPIGTILVMPYFKPQKNDESSDESLPIDWTSFTTKTKAALSFYLNQKFNEVFDTMYFIGEDADNFMTVEYNDSGVKQKNKANPIEVFAATALIDFLNGSKHDVLEIKSLEKEEKPDGSAPLTAEMLNEINNDFGCFTKMAKFLKFSILYTKYFYPCLEDGRSPEKWEKRKYKKIDKEKDNCEALNAVCKSYIQWIKELTIMTDEHGKTDYSHENNKVQWFCYKDFSKLYDTETPIKSKEEGFPKHKVYDYEEFDDLSYILKGNETGTTGRQIIYDLVNEPSVSKGKKDGADNSQLRKLMQDILELC